MHRHTLFTLPLSPLAELAEAHFLYKNLQIQMLSDTASFTLIWHSDLRLNGGMVS